MLTRILETEVMDSWEEAVDYDSMDHTQVNKLFVSDYLAFDPQPTDVLDLGTGTALIPIELCRALPECRVMAGDAATSMLDLAHYNVQVANFSDRIQLCQIDAKALVFADGMFGAVISNSIIHHIPEPQTVIAEAVRVCAAGGVLFFRDLLRPNHEAEWQQLVTTYAGECNEHQRQMFADSLRAALSLAEIRELIAAHGFDPASVQATSDRHWTWAARKN
jgi:ubiquinone/menaquinone biosynthesis C-methylase UbiE